MSIKGSCLCPACGKDLAPRRIHEHTSQCISWSRRFGDPIPYFKYSASPVFFFDGAVEGKDFVRCRVCAGFGWDFRFARLMDHLTSVHKLTEERYLALYPDASVRLTRTLESRKASVRERYGVDNVFQSEEIKAKGKKTLLQKYGVDHPNRSPEIRARTAVTNLERYGTENPFASSEIQEKIRQSNLQRYGVVNPNQHPDVIAKRIATNRVRYGVDHFVEGSVFKAKLRTASLTKYGVDHPMRSDLVKARHAARCLELLGATNPFAIPEIRRKAYNSNVANHGGKHSLADPAIIESRKQTLLAKYGVDNISKVPEVRDKIISILKSKWESGAVPKKNKFERAVELMLPEYVVYSGDWSYWTTWENGHHKNPDFVVLTQDQLDKYRSGALLNDLRTDRVIETNGIFWHTKHKSLAKEAREREFVEGYASSNVQCLVIWEDDLKADPIGIAEKIRKFLNG